jgi:hypothetical protein
MKMRNMFQDVAMLRKLCVYGSSNESLGVCPLLFVITISLRFPFIDTWRPLGGTVFFFFFFRIKLEEIFSNSV